MSSVELGWWFTSLPRIVSASSLREMKCVSGRCEHESRQGLGEIAATCSTTQMHHAIERRITAV